MKPAGLSVIIAIKGLNCLRCNSYQFLQLKITI